MKNPKPGEEKCIDFLNKLTLLQEKLLSLIKLHHPAHYKGSISSAFDNEYACRIFIFEIIKLLLEDNSNLWVINESSIILKGRNSKNITRRADFEIRYKSHNYSLFLIEAKKMMYNKKIRPLDKKDF